MKNRITSAEAKALRRRWKAVNAAEREELLKTPIRRKLLQLAALMASADKMGRNKKLAMEETVVRERWNRLRKVLVGKNSKTAAGEKTKKV